MSFLPGAADQLPERLDVLPLGPQVADGDTQGMAPCKNRVGEEERPGGVDAGEEPLVEAVLGLGRPACRAIDAGAGADGAEGDRDAQLEAGVGLDPGGELAGEAAMLADALPQALDAEGADHHPQLEGAEAAAELETVIHQ